MFRVTGLSGGRESGMDGLSTYNAAPDLQVVVSNEKSSATVDVHSQILMIASPVWRSMLTTSTWSSVLAQ